ncbi:MAG: tryptophan--tRNA ligase [Candidatus Caenarcaniphilales bacterium]|nr:tryptophan--tRNA ligase [Candidatus Caenarcaniphilales bacterium]
MSGQMSQSLVKQNLVSGMRPTGKLHIGHYLGVLRNWVQLQNSEKYNCFFFIADWHSLTTKISEETELESNIIEVARDFLACGLDPNKSTIYVQSAIPEIAELHLLLSMITPNNWAERDPTLKDLVRAAANSKKKILVDSVAPSDQNEHKGSLDMAPPVKEAGEVTKTDGEKSNLTYGMLGYPVLQTSDILTFRGYFVPVGKDQEAHLEMSRDIANRFNYLFETDFFPEPKPLFTETPTVKGTDGGKMSKSFNNDIKISATEEETWLQVKKMITDTQRIKRTDPGDTDRCLVPFTYYKIFAEPEVINKTKLECETALRGCMDCKKLLAEVINNYFKEIREKRQLFSDAEILSILEEGNLKAQSKAKETLKKVRELMQIPDWKS